MSLYKSIINNEEKISLIGLGYVGMPIAVAFANKGIDVIGFDLNKEKIELYKTFNHISQCFISTDFLIW